MSTLDFYFDFSCPYAYLASTQLERIRSQTGVSATLKPMLLGGVFRANDVPQNLFASLGAAKARHNALDLQRHADLWEVPYNMPPGHPFRTVEALRTLLVTGPPYDGLMHAFFRAYWVEGQNIGSEDVLLAILAEHGHDAADVLRRTQEQTVKAELRSRTDEAISAGVFGAPTFIANGEFYWGQDRIDEVISQLGGPPSSARTQGLRYPVDFYFDFSSPFACLGFQKVRKVFGDQANLRPMLLGGVFKSIGMHNVPLFSLNAAKKRWVSLDLGRQAEACGFSFQWPSTFPVNSVLPLRIALLIQRDHPALLHAFCDSVFTAYWSQGDDISSKERVASICDALGLDGTSLVHATQDPTVKELLLQATNKAVDEGVFGAPTTVVNRGSEQKSLFWGSDRMELARAMAAGKLAQSM